MHVIGADSWKSSCPSLDCSTELIYKHHLYQCQAENKGQIHYRPKESCLSTYHTVFTYCILDFV